MQTFLPYASFEESARCLDNKRLGKQRVEALQILQTLSGVSTGWRNHPAVKMWRGHGGQLCLYAAAIIHEWCRRGYRDSCMEQVISLQEKFEIYNYSHHPIWLGSAEFHSSHKSNLLRKDPAWYSQFGWTEPDDLPYVWPVR